LLLKDRLHESLGHSKGAVKRPFNVVNVIPEMPKQQPQPVAESQRVPAPGQRSRTTSGAAYYQVRMGEFRETLTKIHSMLQRQFRQNFATRSTDLIG